MIRLSSFNAVVQTVPEFYCRDSKSLSYLTEARETQYMNVTMKELRENVYEEKNADFVWLFWDWYGEFWRDAKSEWKDFHTATVPKRQQYFTAPFFMVFVAIAIFFSAPIYFVSKMWTLFFPIWIVLYLYFGYGVNIWNTDSIDLFQIVMMTIYLAGCGIIWILFIANCFEQYMMHHLLPSMSSLPPYISEAKADQLLKDITNHYFGMIVVPIRKAMVIEHFGPDLGPIILSYLPTKDEYNVNENIAKVRTV